MNKIVENQIADYVLDKKIKTYLLDAEVILSSLTGKSREIFLTKPNFFTS